MAGFSPLCEYDETFLKPCSLGLIRMKRSWRYPALTPLSLGGKPGAVLVVTIAGNCTMLIPVGRSRRFGAVVHL